MTVQTRTPNSSRLRARRRWRKSLLFVAAFVLTVAVLLPVYWMVVTSVSPSSLVANPNPPLFPHIRHDMWQAYSHVLTRTDMLRWTLNTIFVAGVSVLASSFVAALAGYALSRFRTGTNSVVGLALLLSRMLPASLLVIPMYIFLSRLHLINTFTGLILANVAVIVPLATWMMKTFFDGIPRELDEAAMMDGCSEFGALTRVIMPLARPGLGATAIYGFILSWANFVFAVTLVNQPSLWLLTMGIYSFIGEYLVQWPEIMAAGVLSLIPVIILFVILEPFLVSGMAEGSVKA